MYSRSSVERCSTVVGTLVTLPAAMKELLMSVALGAGSLSPA